MGQLGQQRRTRLASTRNRSVAEIFASTSVGLVNRIDCFHRFNYIDHGPAAPFFVINLQPLPYLLNFYKRHNANCTSPESNCRGDSR